MSFEPNDNANMIHLGNYEEFFILYMDNELNEEKVKMVDEFLAANPDLKAEFEILMSTRLPVEEFSFDKKDLLAENMKFSSIDEELLLYIDNELPFDNKEKLELKLASGKSYQLQHQALLQAKLDPSEKIIYPNKKELYRREERVVSIKIWMRVAAAIIIIAVGGILYFQKLSSPSTTGINPETTAGANKNNQKNDLKKNVLPNQVNPSSENPGENEIVISNSVKKEGEPNKGATQKEIKVKLPLENNALATNSNNNIPKEIIEEKVERPVVRSIESNPDKRITETTASINNSDVTSLNPDRTTINGTPEEIKLPEGEPATAKGSIKGFLRKATRLIEKRTGIDPTNDGELLIGAVAINLK